MPSPSPSISPAEALHKRTMQSAAALARDEHAHWLQSQPAPYKLATGNLPVYWSAVAAQGKPTECLQTYADKVEASVGNQLEHPVHVARFASAQQFFRLVNQVARP